MLETITAKLTITALILWHAGGGARVINKMPGVEFQTLSGLLFIIHSINSTVAKIIQNNKIYFLSFLIHLYHFI